MRVDKLERETKKLLDDIAVIVSPKFSYYEQELVRRIIKSILPQLKSSIDISTAREILKKTEWLDNGTT